MRCWKKYTDRNKLALYSILVLCAILCPSAKTCADDDIDEKAEESLFAPDPFTDVYEFLQKASPHKSAFRVDRVEELTQPLDEQGAENHERRGFYHTIEACGGLGEKNCRQFDGIYGMESKILNQVILGKYLSLGNSGEEGYRENIQLKYDLLFNLTFGRQLSCGLEYFRNRYSYQSPKHTGTPPAYFSTQATEHRYFDVGAFTDLGKYIKIYFDGFAEFDQLEDESSSYKHRTLGGEFCGQFILPNWDYLTKVELNVYRDWMSGAENRATFINISLENELPIKDHLFLTFGGRIDSYRNLITRFYPTAGIHLRINPKTGFYLYYQPQLSRLDFHRLFIDERYSTVSEPLKPTQEYTSITAGFNYNFSQLIESKVELYRKDVLDYIYYTDYNCLITPANLHQATIYGIKISYSFKASERFNHYASLKIEDIIDDENAFQVIPYHPRITFDAGIEISPLSFWELGVEGKFTGDRSTSYPETTLDSYFILNTRSVLWITPYLGFDLHLDNLLNSRYEEISNLIHPGRFISAGLRLKI